MYPGRTRPPTAIMFGRVTATLARRVPWRRAAWRPPASTRPAGSTRLATGARASSPTATATRARNMATLSATAARAPMVVCAMRRRRRCTHRHRRHRYRATNLRRKSNSSRTRWRSGCWCSPTRRCCCARRRRMRERYCTRRRTSPRRSAARRWSAALASIDSGGASAPGGEHVDGRRARAARPGLAERRRWRDPAERFTSAYTPCASTPPATTTAACTASATCLPKGASPPTMDAVAAALRQREGRVRVERALAPQAPAAVSPRFCKVLQRIHMDARRAAQRRASAP